MGWWISGQCIVGEAAIGSVVGDVLVVGGFLTCPVLKGAPSLINRILCHELSKSHTFD